MKSEVPYFIEISKQILSFITTYLKKIPKERRNIFFVLLPLSVLLSTFATLFALYLFSNKLDIKIKNNKIIFGSSYPKYFQKNVIVIEPTFGWQNCGIFVRRNDKITINVEGRVHCGSTHINNLILYAKRLMIQYCPKNSSLNFYKNEFDTVALNKNIFFRRNWTGPEGDCVSDHVLNPSLLKDNSNYGTLLMGIIPESEKTISNTIDKEDPFLVMKDYHMEFSKLFEIKDNTCIDINENGWLVFCVNDAVVSKVFPEQRPRSYELYEALQMVTTKLKSDLHILNESNFPLLFYSDNLGRYNVSITVDRN
ncbi:MAG: hypothetical protein WCO44_09565 [Bacteroidota bacterium]